MSDICIDDIKHDFESCIRTKGIVAQSQQQIEKLSDRLARVEYRDISGLPDQDALQLYVDRVIAEVKASGFSQRDSLEFGNCIRLIAEKYNNEFEELIKKFVGYIETSDDPKEIEVVIDGFDESHFTDNCLKLGPAPVQTGPPILFPPLGKQPNVTESSRLAAGFPPPLIKVIVSVPSWMVVVAAVTFITVIAFKKPIRKLRRRAGC